MKYALPFVLCVLILACGQKESSKTNIYNPNGDSELALLMREMFDDGMVVKNGILEGKYPNIETAFKKIHSADATEPDKVASQVYKEFASAYEASVVAYQEAIGDQKIAAYQLMVSNCMGCHQQLCPGPIRKIKRMELTESELAQLQVK